MIQIEMEMPEFCSVNECPLCTTGWRDKNGYTEWCHRPNGNGFVMVGYCGEENKIPADCPLKEVKQGKWIDMGDFEQCSVCTATHLKTIQTVYGEVTWIKSNYCPACGAKLVHD